MLDNDKSNLKTLNSLSIFNSLSADQQKLITDQTTQLSIKAGETLIKEGDKADTLFFLKQGRLIVFSEEKAIAEILPGESIGEMAFLTGGKRTATVIATRNSKLLQLEKSAYNNLTNDIPELNQSIIESLVHRLTASNLSTPEIEPKAGNVVALLPAGNSAIPDTFIKKFLNINNELSASWKIVQATDFDNVDQLIEWIQNNENQSHQLLLLATGSNEQLALAMAEHADKTFLILDNTQKSLNPISVIEKKVYESSLLNNVDLVILREHSSVKITGTAKILKGRKIHLHHHVALNNQPDLERLQRFIAGKAIGLILCGGGAFGTAHLGMIKALQEHGYYFDIIGGTSIGSVIASIYAMGHDPDTALAHLEEVFINKKALGKYSIPFYSFLDHKQVDVELKKAGDNTDIEDLPINFFATATNLSSNQLHVMQKGPLWQAVRSSCSLPGILPPFITDDGEVLIDGGLMDNTPINTLRSIKSGPNVVMNFPPLKAWRVNSNYEALPRGWSLLKHVFLPKSKSRNYYPTIFTILSRAMVTNTIKRFSEIDQKGDVFLEPKRLKGMGMMNWKKSREQFELSYKQLNSALTNAEVDTSKHQIVTLREVANNMKQSKKDKE